MISKELLSEVYFDEIKPKIKKIEKYNSNAIRIYWHTIYPCPSGVHNDFDLVDVVVNIYELAHKCKEWALSKDFCLSVVRDIDKELILFIGLSLDNEGVGYTEIFNGEDEVELIFKACQYVLDNK